MGVSVSRIEQGIDSEEKQHVALLFVALNRRRMLAEEIGRSPGRRVVRGGEEGLCSRRVVRSDKRETAGSGSASSDVERRKACCRISSLTRQKLEMQENLQQQRRQPRRP